MQYYDGKLSATYEELSGGADPIMREGTLRSRLARGVVRYARRARGRGVKALVDVDSLPRELRDRLIERHGLPSATGESPNPKEVVVERDLKAMGYFGSYTYVGADGRATHLTDRQINEYATNASVLNALSSEEKRLTLMRDMLGNGGTGIPEILQRVSEALREGTGHTLPRSTRRLISRLRKYEKESYASLVPRTLGNTNSQKISPAAGDLLVALKRSKIPTLSTEEIMKEFNRVAGFYGFQPLESIQTLRSYLTSPAVKPRWLTPRIGEHKTYQAYGYKHKTTMPRERDSLWYIDGTKLNLYYNDHGTLRSLVVVEVIDAYSDCLIGYSVGEQETFELQYKAVRMALERAGHRPYELVHDNQGGQTSSIATEWLDRVAILHRSTQPNRPQSKTIENLFGRLQSQVLKRLPWFTGQNVTAKSIFSRPNVEWLKANLNLLPQSAEEVSRQYGELREVWNQMPHHRTGIARRKMYEESKNVALTSFSESDRRDLFLLTRPRPITFTGDGLDVQDGEEVRSYDAYTHTSEGELTVDWEWRAKHVDETFVVRYDPKDDTRVYLYRQEASGDLRYERKLMPKVVIHRAAQEQTAEDRQWIRQIEREDKRARLELEADGRATDAVWRVGKPSLAPDPKSTRAEDHAYIDQATDQKVRERRAALAREGIHPVPLQPLSAIMSIEPAAVEKVVSMMTWDTIEGALIEAPKDKRKSAGGAIATPAKDSARDWKRKY